jgi:hypothetical protein
MNTNKRVLKTAGFALAGVMLATCLSMTSYRLSLGVQRLGSLIRAKPIPGATPSQPTRAFNSHSSDSSRVFRSAARIGTARVRGLVTDSRGKPLGNVTLRFRSFKVGNVIAVETDREGRFEVAELPAGQYNLCAATAGYVKVCYGQRGPLEPVRILEIGAGETRDGVDLVLLRGGVIAGRIGDDVGQPVGNAVVNAMRVTETQEPNETARIRKTLIQDGAVPDELNQVVRTDDLGRFRIYGLPPAAYYVLATRDDAPSVSEGRSQDHFPTYFPGTTDFERARPLKVSLGQQSVANFAIIPARLVRVRGWVINSSGSLVTAGVVRAVRRYPTGALVSLPRGTTRIQTDGSFTIQVPADGAYILYASVGRPFVKPGVQNDIEIGRASITVQTEELSNVRVTTVLGGVISGRVLTSRDVSTADVAALRVSPVALDPEEAAAGVLSSTLVQADGTFELRNVFGHILVDIGAPGAVGWLKAVFVNDQEVSDAGIDVGAAEHLRGVQIVLGDPKTEVFGLATTVAGQPARNCVVLLFAADERKWRHPLARYVRVTRSTEDGNYSIGGLPSGDYLAVSLEHIQSESATEPSILARLRSAATQIRFADGEKKELNLTLLHYMPDQNTY